MDKQIELKFEKTFVEKLDEAALFHLLQIMLL